MRLILVRHGATENLKYNGVTDVPLSRNGYLQAELIKRRLEKEPIRKIYTSDLSRAVETAKTINLPHGVEIEIEPDLREINFGLWEGLAFPEISTRYKEQFGMWMKEAIDFRFPEGGTLGEVRRRVIKVLTRIKMEQKGKDVAIVGHGGPIKIMLCEVLNLDLANFWKISLDRGSVSLVELGEESQMVSLMNDTCHLTPPFPGGGE
ncbi:hypothetical protein A3H38_04250 [candidate division WOR-1 bacterium RIFCSPLOWO2_02_FULL_46_20]|uniref:Alpha-ribazole phosphatase n=1 Tax=candidate division WOR-1 bacterium RIFCSPLOWO2_02_FULL_46_20 TaxID=1802567 RepID=A0A1F4RD04_UNCSA|nr:MAG: hypothetical protein A3H38_04250 [candidate division WOR-1 bacterium RIFCSPLOWO2_02_FULL_46_20]